MIEKCENVIDKILAISFKKYLNLTGLQSKTFSTSYGEMHYYDSNPASSLRPLVFVHGLGSSAQSWWILAEMLKNKRRILIPDLFHMSGLSKANNTGMDIFEHADSIREFIEALGGVKSEKPVDLCGLSLGGWISMIVAAKNQRLVHKLILLNPAGIKINLNVLHNTLKFLDRKKFRSLYPGIMKAFPFTQVPLVRHFTRHTLFRGLNSIGVQKFVDNTKIEHFVDDLLPQIQCPVLLLWGKDDQFLSYKSPEIIIKKIKNIEAKWVHNCAHVLALEAPVTCYREIISFLNLSGIKDNKFCRIVFSCGRVYPVTSIEV